MTNEAITLDALCESPLKVHVGKEEVEVHPPSIAQLHEVGKLWVALIKKLVDQGENLKAISSDKKQPTHEAMEANLTAIYKHHEDYLPICGVYLAERGEVESKFTIDELRKGLDVQDMKRILEYCKKVGEVGDLSKNVVVLVSPEQIKEAMAHGQPS